MGTKPWWRRLDGVPPPFEDSVRHAQARRRRLLSRKEVWLARLVLLAAVALIADKVFLTSGQPWGYVIPVVVPIAGLLCVPPRQRRQVLGLRPKADDGDDGTPR